MGTYRTLPYMYDNLNMKDLAELKEKEKFILIFPLGSIESHGPHCPLATDTMTSMEISLRAAEKLHNMGYEAYVLPSLVYTIAHAARTHPAHRSGAQ